jgi:hypothetical protein
MYVYVIVALIIAGLHILVIIDMAFNLEGGVQSQGRINKGEALNTKAGDHGEHTLESPGGDAYKNKRGGEGITQDQGLGCLPMPTHEGERGPGEGERGRPSS